MYNQTFKFRKLIDQILKKMLITEKDFLIMNGDNYAIDPLNNTFSYIYKKEKIKIHILSKVKY